MQNPLLDVHVAEKKTFFDFKQPIESVIREKEQNDMAKIGIIGLGNMGESILRALLNNSQKKASLVCSETKKERAEEIRKIYGVKCVDNVETIIKQSSHIILAIKPQDAAKVIKLASPYLDDTKILVSIMAGITTSNILSLLNKPAKIIRIMPNICVKTGEGVLGIASNPLATSSDRAGIETILASLGRFVEVGEELMDAVTALGGSGPAFFLLFLEAMIDAGVKTGLPRDKARIITYQVAKGTIAMLTQEDIHPTVMRDMITSPGGTTIAGISTLEQKAFKGSVIEAIENACKRAKELSL